MIHLGLQRIKRLLNFPIKTKAVHVAGTNGKGSICAYTAAALTAAGLRVGKFTSPHLIHKRDSICIDNEPVSQAIFDEATSTIEALNASENIEATPFEILTATAFKIFEQEKCLASVIECGMGGRGDATNAFPSRKKLVTVIAKVGLDHQDFLGNDIEDIAKEKCGIFANNINIIFDETNLSTVLRVIRQEAQKANAYPAYPWSKSSFLSGPINDAFAGDNVSKYLRNTPLYAIPYQLINAELAFRAAYTFIDQYYANSNDSDREQRKTTVAWTMLETIARTSIPGRFQTVDLEPLFGLVRPITLDGAHNSQAIKAVAPALANLRAQWPSGRVTWIVAFSKGKALDEMLGPILQPNDTVIAVEFGPVDGMPWKRAMSSAEIISCCDDLRNLGLEIKAKDFGRDIYGALKYASSAVGVPIVGIGSLYLVSDILRLLEEATTQKSYT